jgi:hypothetical protein
MIIARVSATIELLKVLSRVVKINTTISILNPYLTYESIAIAKGLMH